MPIRQDYQVTQMAMARKARKRPAKAVPALRVITPSKGLVEAIREMLPYHLNGTLECVQILDENTAIVWNSIEQKRRLSRKAVS